MALDLVTPFTKVQLEEEIKDTGRKQVGILGGNFNPVHNAHLVVADQVRQQLGLDEVLLMPEFEPPHVDKKETINEQHRLNMLMLAINGIEGLDIETIELERKGISYTYDTMKLLTEANPDTDYYFIIGADSLYNFATWMEPARICQACTIVVATRDHVPVKNLDQEMTYLSKQYGGCFIRLETLNIDISSQLLRQWHQEDKSIRYYVPDAVVNYIEENQIYHPSEMIPDLTPTEGDNVKMADYDFIKMQKKLAKYLDEDRYAHTLGVMYTCASLAMVHGYDLKDAQAAGLLHDSAKCIPNKKKLKMCEEHKIPVTEFEKTHPFLLHAKLGAYVAEVKYGIKDKEILSSITYHTTGRPDMSLLEKIVYIADYIEPARNKAPNLTKVRKLAFEDLDECMYEILKDTLSYLEENPKDVDSATKEAFEFYSDLHNTRFGDKTQA